MIDYILKDMIEPLTYLPWGLIAGVLFLALERIWCQYFRVQKQTNEKNKRWLIFFCIVYIVVILNLTFLSREPGSRTGTTFEFLGTWSNSPQSQAYFIENILLFIPFGILLPNAFSIFKKAWTCILLGFFFSLCLESIQLVTGRGFCQLDDILTNTLGTGIGWLCYRVCRRK